MQCTPCDHTTYTEKYRLEGIQWRYKWSAHIDAVSFPFVWNALSQYVQIGIHTILTSKAAIILLVDIIRI